MKKATILLTGMLFVLLIGSGEVLGQVTIDGTFDGTEVWGEAVATNGEAGWADAIANNLYVTSDKNYIYVAADVVAADWMDFGFIINSSSTFGGNFDPWGRRINFSHTELPDVSIRGNMNGGWTEYRLWDGSEWTGGGTNVSAGNSSTNVNEGITTYVEARISRSSLNEASTIDIQFFISGNNPAEHGSFNSIPDDIDANGWDMSANPTVLSNYATAIDISVPVLTTADAGDWSSTATWTAGTLPTSEDIVQIDHDVTLDVDATVLKLSISEGATLTASDASARTLTIANSVSGDQLSLTNNGTWNNGVGGSTVIFTGEPNAGNPHHVIGGSSLTAFENVTIRKENGTSDVGASFQTGTTVTGTLRIGNGGYVATAPPENFYGENAILDFNQGSGANYEVNFGDNSWSTTEVPNNITITSGTVTLNEARTLTGELLIQSGAELVTNGHFNLATGGVLSNNGTITGDLNFLRDLTAEIGGFRLLASPVESSYSDLLDAIWTQGATGSDSPSAGDPNVFTWDSTAADNNVSNWVGVSDLTQTITAGTGFLVAVYEDDNYSAEGGTDWPKTLSVSGTENAVDASPAINSNGNGWTLVGNPFASTIDFDDVEKVDLTDATYVWDPNESESGNWKTYAEGAGDLTNGLISPFQGFFVQTVETPASTPDITFGSASKSAGATFYGKTKAEERAVVRLQVEGNGLSNSAWLQFSENGSETEQVRGDAVELESLNAQYAQLAFSKNNESLLDIAHLPVQSGEYEVPVQINATKSGEYTLTATDFEIPAGMELIFHDYENEVELKITKDFSYSFELQTAAKASAVPPLKRLQAGALTAKAENSQRFGITVMSKSGVSNEPSEKPVSFSLDQNYPNPFNPSTVISYQLSVNSVVTLKVYDVMGREVAALVDGRVSAGKHQVIFDASALSSGIYYYRLQSAGQVLTRQMTLIK